MKTSQRSVLCQLLLSCSLATGLHAAPPAAPAKPAAPAAPAANISPLDLSDMLKAGDAAFNSGDWATASTKLVQYLQNAEKLGITEKQDVILYVIGIAFTQQKQWGPALEHLKKYESKFPTAEYIKDVQMLIGKVSALSGDFKGAATQFEKIRNIPDLRDQVLPLLAEAYEKDDQGGEAVKVLEDYLRAGYNSTDRINSALRLASLYLGSGNVEQGVNVLDKIKNSPSAADFVIIINAKAIETAMKLLDDGKPELALISLQAVRRKSEVIRLQNGRNAVLKGKIAEWSTLRARFPGAPGAKFQSLVEEGNARLKQLEELQAAVEKDEGYDAVVIYHIGRCFDKLKRYWESELAFRTIVNKYKSFPSVSSAMFGQIISLVNLKEKDKALELCKKFLKEYPKAEEVATISELAVTMAMEAGDFELAKRTAQEIITGQPDNPSVNKLLLYSIGADFSLYAFKNARIQLEEYRKRFPNDAFKEEIDYRYALTYFFENDYRKTIDLLGKYITDYPNGLYKTDARYRLNIVTYGEQQSLKNKAGKDLKNYTSQFRTVIDDVRDILSKDPNTQVAGELYALMGDCYDQMTFKEVEEMGIDQDKESGDAYMQGALKATNNDVLDYCMEQARTKLQAAGRWAEMRKLHEEFVKTRPTHPDRLKGIYWVCRSMSREAKTAEEKVAANENVKKFLSTEILTAINRPNTEGVEMLLEQLAQACVPKRKPRAMTPPTEPGKDAPVAAPTPPPSPDEDPFTVGAKELDKWLGGSTGKLNGTGEARLMYAKVQLLRMVPAKADPSDPKKRIDRAPEIEKLMDELGQKVNPDDLSSTLLAFVGDHLRKRGVNEKATVCYNGLINRFPKSDYVDFGLVGLGDIAFEQKDYPGAEKLYARARDEMPGMKYPNALMGVAKAQFMQGNYKDPEKPLVEIVGTKEWKGELTAEALFWLGECAFAQKNYPVAVNYYQRIFLSFGKFTDWAIKGYNQAAECFKAMGEPDKAKNHLIEARDFLKKRKMETSPQMQSVKDQAGKLGINLGL